MEICDTIEFNIGGKLKKIELCLGDITKLPIEDSVDLLLVSAFPNNYVPVHGTLIGALLNNLELSVKQLAKDKAEDLRTNFHCWISKELPSHLPFRRILCLEQNANYLSREDPTNLVGAMFRALFTTFNSNEWSMITPILGTGNQMSNKVKMLNEMVRACSAWIAAGMPLSCMKIVIFKNKDSKYLNKDDNEAIVEFSRLKSEINWNPYKNINSIRYDVLFFCVTEDEEVVNIFIKMLDGLFNDNPINMKLKCLNKTNDGSVTADYDIYKKFQRNMLESRKVGIFLSNDFIGNPRAIEVYNLALCLSQKTHKSLLTPVCLNHIIGLPAYMSLNQWINCRLKKEIMKVEDQIQNGVNTFFQILESIVSTENNNEEKQTDPNFDFSDQDFVDISYDIFISYSHKDDMKCKTILNFLEVSLPDVKIFYDKINIKTGFSWQETIYNSLNGSKIILALLSENYIQSTMCNEEFNIAISQHWSSQFQSVLFPIWISDIDVATVITNDPGHFNKSYLMNGIFVPSFLEATSDHLSSEIKIIALSKSILNNLIRPYLLGENIHKYFPDQPSIDFTIATSTARSSFFSHIWNLKKDLNFVPCKEEFTLNAKHPITKKNDIAIGFHFDDLVYANYLKTSILTINQELKIVFCSLGHKSDEWQSLKDIETAHLIVILLKPYYIMTKSCRDQLHIAISLQRSNSGVVVLPIILETLPQKPAYIHLLPSRFKADDEIYLKYSGKMDYTKTPKGSQPISCLYDSHITKRMAVMLTFASHYVAEVIFLKRSFNIPKSSVIYSTFDLLNTNFNTPICADAITAKKQIKILNISNEDINLAKIFKSQNVKIVNQNKPITENTVLLPVKQDKIYFNSMTKVCSIM